MYLFGIFDVCYNNKVCLCHYQSENWYPYKIFNIEDNKNKQKNPKAQLKEYSFLIFWEWLIKYALIFWS